MERVIDHITSWLDDYSTSAGTRGFVIGVSGGIDSAVASTLAARTGRPSCCVELPIYQSSDQVTRAREHIDALERDFDNVRSLEIPLTPVFDALLLAFRGPGEARDDDASELALVNTRARLRMTTLYYVAALGGDLVVGTGNKVEDFGIGFFTKYGDGGVDLSPIADLDKTEVYRLGEALGVSRAILDAPPTDGLWGDDRTDEDQIGAGYPELEWAMGFDAGDGEDVDLTERQRTVLEIYRRHRRQNLHKMAPIPVCVIPDELRADD